MSSNPKTNQMVFTEPSDGQSDNQCEDTVIETASSIQPSPQQQRKTTTRAKSSIAQQRCTMRLRRPSTRKAPTNRYR